MVDDVRALVFDVFGTLVDWRSGVARELARIAGAHDIRDDWFRFADDWRALYRPALRRVIGGERAWAPLDVLQRETFSVVWAQRNHPALDDAAIEDCVLAWHRLDPWPDVRTGLEHLRQRFITATLSNGSVRLLIDLARHGDLRFDTLLCGETFSTYKPDPRTYLGAAEQLGVTPEQTMLVAAHADDLQHAAACGLRTAYVHRPLEHGPSARNDDPLAGGAFRPDLRAGDLHDLARQLSNI
jgi:2-haloacid dehalogenase